MEEKNKHPWGETRWVDMNYGKITIEEINQCIRDIFHPAGRFVIGFHLGVPTDEVWLINDAYRQNGKRIFLLEANSKIHKAILEQEEKDSVNFERLADCAMEELVKLGFHAFTDEEGKLKEFHEEPWGLPITQIFWDGKEDINKFWNNTLI